MSRREKLEAAGSDQSDACYLERNELCNCMYILQYIALDVMKLMLQLQTELTASGRRPRGHPIPFRGFRRISPFCLLLAVSD